MAFLTGNQASFNWSGASETLRVQDFFYWTQDNEKTVATFKPFGWASPVRVPTGSDAVIRAYMYVDSSTTPPIPTGTQGTLTCQTIGTPKRYTFAAIAVSQRVQARSDDASGQVCIYTFAYSATASSDVTAVT